MSNLRLLSISDGEEARKAAASWWVIGPLSLSFFVAYSVLSLGRHGRLQTSSYDLGIFTQAVRGYATSGLPTSEIKGPGFNLLGDHFHPVLAALAPFYRLWPDARMLLVAQSVLIAASVIPIGRLAIRRTGTLGGCLITCAYGLSWGLQGAIGFDFHEIAFAVPLLAFAMVALAEQRWRSAAAWAIPLLLVKEDMGLTVIAIGLYLTAKRARTLGLFLAAAGAAAVVLTVTVLIPAFNWAGVYPYKGRTFGGLSDLAHLPGSFLDHPGKLGLIALLLATTAFTGIRSDLILIAVSSLAARLISSNPLYWSTGDVHYNATLMPIVFVALIAGTSALQASPWPILRRYVKTAPWISTALAVALLPHLAFSQLGRPVFYQSDPHAAAAMKVLALIPDGSSVAASSNLAPHLVTRTDVVIFPSNSTRPVQWIILDMKRRSNVPRTTTIQDAALTDLPALGFSPITEKDGIVLYHRAPDSQP